MAGKMGALKIPRMELEMVNDNEEEEEEEEEDDDNSNIGNILCHFTSPTWPFSD